MKRSYHFLVVIIILSSTLINGSDARNCSAKLSLENSKVTPNNSSKIGLEISSSNDMKNIISAIIILKIDSRLEVQTEGFSGTGFLASANLNHIPDEAKYRINFYDSNYVGGNAANATIPVIAKGVGSYEVSIEKAVLNDGDRIEAEVYPLDPLKLECISLGHNSSGPITPLPPEPIDGNETELDPECIEYDFSPDTAYIHTPLSFTANVSRCPEVESCTLAWANSTPIQDWKKHQSMKHTLKELPYGDYKFWFTVWFKEFGAKRIPIEKRISKLDPLEFTLMLYDAEKYLDEPFKVSIKCYNRNDVDIQNVTVRMSLPDGTEFYNGSDFKVIDGSLETMPKEIAHNDEIIWTDIRLKGVKTITVKFPKAIEYFYYYNGFPFNDSSNIETDEIIIKPREDDNAGKLKGVRDFLKQYSFLILVILSFLSGLMVRHIVYIEFKIAGEMKQGIRLYNNRSYDDALDHFKQALKINNSYYLPNYYNGMIMLIRNDYAKAAEFLGSACESYPPCNRYEQILHFYVRRQKVFSNLLAGESFEILNLMLRADDVLSPSKLIGRLRCNKDDVLQDIEILVWLLSIPAPDGSMNKNFDRDLIWKHLVHQLTLDASNLLIKFDTQKIPQRDLKVIIAKELNRIICESQLPDLSYQDPNNAAVGQLNIYNYQTHLEINRDRLDQAFSGIITKSRQATAITKGKNVN